MMILAPVTSVTLLISVNGEEKKTYPEYYEGEQELQNQQIRIPELETFLIPSSKSPAAESKDSVVFTVYNKIIVPLEEAQPKSKGYEFSRGLRVPELRYHLVEVKSKESDTRDFDLHYIYDRVVHDLDEEVNPYMKLRYDERTEKIFAKEGDKWIAYEEHSFLKMVLATKKQS